MRPPDHAGCVDTGEQGGALASKNQSYASESLTVLLGSACLQLVQDVAHNGNVAVQLHLPVNADTQARRETERERATETVSHASYSAVQAPQQVKVVANRILTSVDTTCR